MQFAIRLKATLWVGFLFSYTSLALYAQPFVEVETNILGVGEELCSWGDFDHDGDWDAFCPGRYLEELQLWRNNGNAEFTQIATSFPGASQDFHQRPQAQWLDFDGDGVLDLFWGEAFYHHDGNGVFSEFMVLPELDSYDTSEIQLWTDFDRDADLDVVRGNLALMNTGNGGFRRVRTPWPSVKIGDRLLAADYDRDGDLDILFNDDQVMTLYVMEDHQRYRPITSPLGVPGSRYLTWADYDGDGDFDVLYGAVPGPWNFYRNDNGAFNSTSVSFDRPGGFEFWRDIDGDGDLDFFTVFYNSAGTSIFRITIQENEQASFTSAGPFIFDIEPNNIKNVTPIDVDGDGDLDFVLQGRTADPGRSVSVLLNQQNSATNTPPTPPTNLQASVEQDRVVLTWDPGTDSQQTNLTYNVRIGSQPRASDVLPPQSVMSTGQRLVPAPGNNDYSLTRVLQNVAPGTYYWSVQSVDAGYKASAFAATGSFTTTAPDLPFTAVPIDQPALPSQQASQAMDWGDYDDDGDLDFALTDFRSDEAGMQPLRVYRNEGDRFTYFDVEEGYSYPDVEWIDVNGDSHLDLATGNAFFLGDGMGGFQKSYTTLDAYWLQLTDAEWGDYDNDGDLDLLSVSRGFGAPTTIYRNDGNGVFIDREPGFTQYTSGTGRWIDYDNDGDLDVVMGGESRDGFSTIFPTTLFRNEGADQFSQVDIPSYALEQITMEAGDYDADGDLDLLITGWKKDSSRGADNYAVYLYRNDGGTFVDLNFPVAGSDGIGYWYSLSWVDYDSDGDLDIAALATEPWEGSLFFYRNEGSVFVEDTESDRAFPRYIDGYAQWADYNGDGKLDMLAHVQDVFKDNALRVFQNNMAPRNTPPMSPAGLQAVVTGDAVQLTWEPATDAESPSASLSYHVRVGTTPGGSEVMSGADQYGPGNVGQQTSKQLSNLIEGTYYWSVQTVDAGYSRSAFTQEQQFTITDSHFRQFSIIEYPLAENMRTVWGDYDSDGDMDFIALARFARKVQLYRNEGDFSFQGVAGNIPQVEGGNAEWGDYDGDGDLDLVLVGRSSELTAVLRNDGGQFANIYAELPEDEPYYAGWQDYDADGDLDLLVLDRGRLHMYRNHEGRFIEAQAGLAQFWAGTNSFSLADSPAWGDFDQDGYPDLAISGYLLRNDEGRFYDTGIKVPGGPLTWIDYDGDGDLDLVATSKILINTDGTFTAETLPCSDAESSFSDVDLADYDNDGDLDFLVQGGQVVNNLCNNDGGDVFRIVPSGLRYQNRNQARWVDIDRDGDLDIAMDPYQTTLSLYRNDGGPPVTDPTVPSGLTAAVEGDAVRLNWDAASDAEWSSLTYNVRVGTTPGGSEVVSAMADPDTGAPYTLGKGQTGPHRFLHLNNLRKGTYYWSVQALDPAGGFSTFSDEKTFEITQENVQSLVRQGVGLPALGQLGHLAPHDYDGDGDVDLFLFGTTRSGDRVAQLYRNDLNLNLTLVQDFGRIHIHHIFWGDIDNDGDSDLLLSFFGNGYSTVKPFLNEGTNGFVGVDLSFSVAYNAALAWLDYDNDSDLDLISGRSLSQNTQIFVHRNDGNLHFESHALILGEKQADAFLPVDYDTDGDVDLFAWRADEYSGADPIPTLFRNDNGSFTPLSIWDKSVIGTADWGDYDGDGDPDLLIGSSEIINHTRYYTPRILRNDGADTFQAIDILPAANDEGTLRWVDADNDGDLDILHANGLFSYIYENMGENLFRDMPIALPPSLSFYSNAWLDIDNDFDLDLLLAPASLTQAYEDREVQLFVNESTPDNTAPASPTELRAVKQDEMVLLQWNPSSDAQTPTAGLLYNVRVGTTPGGSDILAPTGPTSVTEGNAWHNTEWPLRLAPNMTYYWSVQAVDGTQATSAFAPEVSFSVSDTGIGEGVALPEAFAQYGNYPNPFQKTTTIQLDLPEEALVGITIYDVTGRAVLQRSPRMMAAGRRQPFSVDASTLGSGLYLYRLTLQASQDTHQMRGQFVVVK